MYIQVGFENGHGEVFEVRKERGLVYVNGDEFDWEDQPLFADGFIFSDAELIVLGRALVAIGQSGDGGRPTTQEQAKR